MKNIISILFFALSGFVSYAQNKNPNAPIFKFVEETHDFGNLKEGPVASHDFVFYNGGKEPLIIQSCTASCGCTTPDWTKEPILPGQKGKITVKYNTQGRQGPFNKTVYISSNAKSDKERYEIYIKGNVIPETPDKK
jgi:Protein of unknown function (DUF1573).